MSKLHMMEEKLIVRTLECHYRKNQISVTTVPDFIAFCGIVCAEKWKIPKAPAIL